MTTTTQTTTAKKEYVITVRYDANEDLLCAECGGSDTAALPPRWTVPWREPITPRTDGWDVAIAATWDLDVSIVAVDHDDDTVVIVVTAD